MPMKHTELFCNKIYTQEIQKCEKLKLTFLQCTSVFQQCQSVCTRNGWTCHSSHNTDCKATVFFHP